MSQLKWYLARWEQLMSQPPPLYLHRRPLMALLVLNERLWPCWITRTRMKLRTVFPQGEELPLCLHRPLMVLLVLNKRLQRVDIISPHHGLSRHPLSGQPCHGKNIASCFVQSTDVQPMSIMPHAISPYCLLVLHVKCFASCLVFCKVIGHRVHASLISLQPCHGKNITFCVIYLSPAFARSAKVTTCTTMCYARKSYITWMLPVKCLCLVILYAHHFWSSFECLEWVAKGGCVVALSNSPV